MVCGGALWCCSPSMGRGSLNRDRSRDISHSRTPFLFLQLLVSIPPDHNDGNTHISNRHQPNHRSDQGGLRRRRSLTVRIRVCDLSRVIVSRQGVWRVILAIALALVTIRGRRTLAQFVRRVQVLSKRICSWGIQWTTRILDHRTQRPILIPRDRYRDENCVFIAIGRHHRTFPPR